mgnify:CR=1 FL=1
MRVPEQAAVDRVLAPVGQGKRPLLSAAAPLTFGAFITGDLYTEYRACNATTGRRADTVNLRVYQADPYAEPDERKKQRNRIQNAYEALSHV